MGPSCWWESVKSFIDNLLIKLNSMKAETMTQFRLHAALGGPLSQFVEMRCRLESLLASRDTLLVCAAHQSQDVKRVCSLHDGRMSRDKSS